MSYSKLSADPTALILGIIAIVISLAGCCCGIFAIVPVVLSIIGLVMANNSLKEFRANPELYDPQSRSNVSTARVLNIIGLILGGLITLFYIAYFAIYGTMFSQIFKEAYEAQQNGESYHYEWDSETDDDYRNETETDTIQIDSMAIDNIETEASH